jgi:glutamyl-tRNA reductase
MGIKYNPNESYECWLEKVRMEETGVALRRLAKGDDVNLVMEAMSARIIEKCQFPIFKAINQVDK